MQGVGAKKEVDSGEGGFSLLSLSLIYLLLLRGRGIMRQRRRMHPRHKTPRSNTCYVPRINSKVISRGALPSSPEVFKWWCVCVCVGWISSTSPFYFPPTLKPLCETFKDGTNSLLLSPTLHYSFRNAPRRKRVKIGDNRTRRSPTIKVFLPDLYLSRGQRAK